MDEKPKRKRITTEYTSINDTLEYKQNSCSRNARQIELHTHKVVCDIWADKHYNIRVQHGDDDGEREGIEVEKVLPLIRDTFVHVLNYGLKYGKIVNFPPFTNNSTRIVLQDMVDAEEETLYVAVEFHFLEIDTYEVTIWTAMKSINFDKRDGQYVIQLHHDRTILWQFIKPNMKQLLQLNRK